MSLLFIMVKCCTRTDMFKVSGLFVTQLTTNNFEQVANLLHVYAIFSAAAAAADDDDDDDDDDMLCYVILHYAILQ